MYYSAKNPADHKTDHLPFRSTRKQWTGERRRAQFSERKGAEKAIFGGKCHHKCVWDAEAASLSLATPTKILTESRVHSPLSVIFYAYLGVSPPLLKKSHFYDHIIKWGLKIPFSFFFVYSGGKFEKSNEQPPPIFLWRCCIRLKPSVQI